MLTTALQLVDRVPYYTAYVTPPGQDPMSVQHALLALLSAGPKYGLQLRQEFEEGTGEIWPLNVGQVYTTQQLSHHRERRKGTFGVAEHPAGHDFSASR
jgi:hypothetical protein